MNSEIPTVSLELTGDFHLFAYADTAARRMNGQDREMNPIVVRVDVEKTEQDESLPEGHHYFVVEGIRRGMKAKFQRTLVEIEEATPRRSFLKH